MVGTVGNLNPAKAEFGEYLERYAKNPLYRGIRYGNLWGYDLPGQIENPQVVDNLKLLAQHDMVLETANQNVALLQAAVRVNDKIPELRIVLDHLPALDPSPENQAGYDAVLKEISQRKNIWTKLSEIVHPCVRRERRRPYARRAWRGCVSAATRPATRYRPRAGRPPRPAGYVVGHFRRSAGGVRQRLAPCGGCFRSARSRGAGAGSIFPAKAGKPPRSISGKTRLPPISGSSGRRTSHGLRRGRGASKMRIPVKPIAIALLVAGCGAALFFTQVSAQQAAPVTSISPADTAQAVQGFQYDMRGLSRRKRRRRRPGPGAGRQSASAHAGCGRHRSHYPGRPARHAAFCEPAAGGSHQTGRLASFPEYFRPAGRAASAGGGGRSLFPGRWRLRRLSYGARLRRIFGS